jgi:hypothetical protein
LSAATVVAATAAATAAAAKEAHENVTLCVHDFLHERLNGVPFHVVGKAKALAVAFHSLLLHLRGIEVAAIDTAANRPALAAPVLAAVLGIILREHIAGAQGQRRGNSAYCQDSIHTMFSFCHFVWVQ